MLSLALPLVAVLLRVPAPPASTVDATLARAQTHYAGGELEYAAIAFARAAGDLTTADPAARWGLARSLYRLGFLASARALFLQIADASRGDPYRRKALPWLASLARKLEPDDEVLAAIATYGPADLEDAEFEEVRDELYFMLGRAQYERGDLEQAIASFSQVDRDAVDYTRAQYLGGVAQTRLWHGSGAVASFKNVLRAQADLRAELGPKQLRRAARFAARRDRLQRADRDKALARMHARMRRKGLDFTMLDELEATQRHDEMASLAMAYVFYQAGQLELAAKYFERVPQESPYWLDAIFGKAWAEFLAAYRDPDDENRHYQRALGHIHTLRAPFFPYRLYPETPLLEAVIFYFNCQYRMAALALDEFDRRYAIVGRSLRKLLVEHREDFALYELDRAVQDGKARLPEELVRVLEGLLDNKLLDQRRALVARLEGERALLLRMPGPFREGPLGERVEEDIDLAVSVAREAAGAAVRRRLQGAVREIQRFERNAIKIRYELEPKLIAARGEEKRKQRPRVGADDERYSYNGEYWQDELGQYNYEISNVCPDR
jgi:tetratricopeptide (TPR) repeat protein